jgi:hypothetical protein
MPYGGDVVPQPLWSRLYGPGPHSISFPPTHAQQGTGTPPTVQTLCVHVGWVDGSQVCWVKDPVKVPDPLYVVVAGHV